MITLYEGNGIRIVKVMTSGGLEFHIIKGPARVVLTDSEMMTLARALMSPRLAGDKWL